MNDLKRYKLNGNVKDLTYVEYEAQYNRKDSTYTLRIFDFLSMANNTVSFNKLGYLEKKIELSADLKDSLSVSAIWTYQYDKLNRIVREFRESKKYGDTTSWNYKYIGENTTLIKQYDKTYHVLYYKYIQDKNIELLTTANSDSSYQCKTKFIYDSKNRLIQYESYENKDSILNLRVLHYNDKSANYDRELNEDRKYKFKINKSYKYDENGNMKEIFNEDLKLIGWFEYIYDNKKNWIEKKCYNSKGKIYNVYKRKIIYY